MALTGENAAGVALEADSAPLIRLVDNFIKLGIREGTTDIHVEPEEKLLRLRFRIDGILQPGPTVPKALQNAVLARLKIMADLNISERRMPQDGRIRYTTGERNYDIRVSVLPTRTARTSSCASSTRTTCRRASSCSACRPACTGRSSASSRTRTACSWSRVRPGPASRPRSTRRSA
jgi:type II secretory ATPase GspE/PulE/Tfp pilus assembly ATPase PilB-like protein